MATLYIIQGFIAAGKTTYSKKLAVEKNATYLNADDYCEANYSDAQRISDWNSCFAESVSMLWEQADSLLRAKHDVIWDLGFWTKDSRDYARKRAAELGAQLTHIYVYEPDDVLIKRIIARDNFVDSLVIKRNLEKFHMLKKQFEVPTADENFIIVSSSLDMPKL